VDVFVPVCAFTIPPLPYLIIDNALVLASRAYFLQVTPYLGVIILVTTSNKCFLTSSEAGSLNKLELVKSFINYLSFLDSLLYKVLFLFIKSIRFVLFISLPGKNKLYILLSVGPNKAKLGSLGFLSVVGGNIVVYRTYLYGLVGVSKGP